MRFPFADEVADSGVCHQNFHRLHAVRAVGSFHEGNRHHSLQGIGQTRADLRFVVRREDINDAVDGLRRRTRVQRCKHEVPGFCGFNGQRHSFVVSHFPHDDDVGIFAKGDSEGVRKGLRMGAYFSLAYETGFVLVNKFAAVTVDLPLPVGPVTSTKPLSSIESFFKFGLTPRSSKEGIDAGISRKAAAVPLNVL